MRTHKNYSIGASIIGITWLLSGISCEKEGMIRSIDPDVQNLMISDSVKFNDSGKSYEQSGISFEMESDSLQDEVEEINLGAKDWDEECMDVDL